MRREQKARRALVRAGGVFCETELSATKYIGSASQEPPAMGRRMGIVREARPDSEDEEDEEHDTLSSP